MNVKLKQRMTTKRAEKSKPADLECTIYHFISSTKDINIKLKQRMTTKTAEKS